MIQSLRRTEDDSYSGIMTLHWSVERPELEEVWSRKTHPDWVDRELWGINAAYVEQPWQRERREQLESGPDSRPDHGGRPKVTATVKPPLEYEKPDIKMPPMPDFPVLYTKELAELFWGVWCGKLYLTQVAEYTELGQHKTNQFFLAWKRDVQPGNIVDRIRKRVDWMHGFHPESWYERGGMEFDEDLEKLPGMEPIESAPPRKRGRPKREKPEEPVKPRRHRVSDPILPEEAELYAANWIGEMPLWKIVEKTGYSMSSVIKRRKRWEAETQPDGEWVRGRRPKIDPSEVDWLLEENWDGKITLKEAAMKLGVTDRTIAQYKKAWLKRAKPDRPQTLIWHATPPPPPKNGGRKEPEFTPEQIDLFERNWRGEVSLKQAAQEMGVNYGTLKSQARRWGKKAHPEGGRAVIRRPGEGYKRDPEEEALFQRHLDGEFPLTRVCEILGRPTTTVYKHFDLWRAEHEQVRKSQT